MVTQSLPLQNLQKVRSKYWFHLIKFDETYTFHKIYCITLVFFFGRGGGGEGVVALIRHPYYLVRAILFLS